MTTKTCLRCDWQGATNAQQCPDCAEPLYELGRQPSAGAGSLVRGHPEERSREAASTAIAAPSSDPPHPSDRPPRPADPAEPTLTRSRSLVAFVVVALVLAFAVGSWLQAHREPSRKPDASPPLDGTLVYAVPDGEGHSRLWRWELSTGRVVRGPRVRRATELVDAGSVSFGWLGVTSELPGGRLRASVLHFLGPDDHAKAVVSGDAISWSPGGASVAAGRRGPLRDGCRRVSIVRATLQPARAEPVYVDPSLCGDLLSVAQESLSTLFTLERGGHVGIFFAGVGRIHSVLPRHALISVSGLSDLLVVPQDGLTDLAPLPTQASQEHDDLPDAELFFVGLDSALPYHDAAEPFSVARVLAWSPDSSVALVVGRSGSRRGLYEVDVAPGDGLDAPSYVGPVSGIPYATFTRDGIAIVEAAEGLFVVRGGSLVRLPAPVDAPAPDGPMVWIH